MSTVDFEERTGARNEQSRLPNLRLGKFAFGPKMPPTLCSAAKGLPSFTHILGFPKIKGTIWGFI